MRIQKHYPYISMNVVGFVNWESPSNFEHNFFFLNCNVVRVVFFFSIFIFCISIEHMPYYELFCWHFELNLNVNINMDFTSHLHRYTTHCVCVCVLLDSIMLVSCSFMPILRNICNENLWITNAYDKGFQLFLVVSFDTSVIHKTYV